MGRLGFIVDRLKEPGSIRSLVLLLFIVRGKTVDEAHIQNLVDGILTLLATVSFLMPGSTPAAAAAAVAPVIQKDVTQLAETTLVDLAEKIDAARPRKD